MKTVFADTYYFIALYVSEDDAHRAAMDFSNGFHGILVTTQWVLVELADAFANPEDRAGIARMIRTIESQTNVIVIPASDDWFHRGIDLYEKRVDKNWSLTDCLSFVAMKERRIKQALTGDRHFEQAGFVALLK